MLSLVIPFYNEESRFHIFTHVLEEYLKTNTTIKQIILVNDGSQDNTLNCLLDFKTSFSSNVEIDVLNIEPNKGKGFAIKKAMPKVTQQWVLCLDADMSYHPNQLDEWINEGWLDWENISTIHFGSREMGMQKGWVEYYTHRRIIGRIYALMLKMITGVTVSDTQCGFKLYPSNIAKEIFNTLQQQRFAFDVEVHAYIKKKNLKIKLLPVRCEEREDSKVNLIKDSWQMFWALWDIRKSTKKL